MYCKVLALNTRYYAYMHELYIYIYISDIFCRDNYLHEETYVRFYVMYSLLQNNTAQCSVQLNFSSQEKSKKYYKQTRKNNEK